MSDEPKNRSRQWIGWAALVLFALYPLSLGPATMLLERINSPTLWRAYHTGYGPLWWAAGSSESLTELLIQYLFWWDPDLPL